MLVKVWSTCPRGRAFFSFSNPVIFRRRDVERARVWMRAERTRAKDVERFDARRECSVREGWTLNGEIKKIKKKKLERGEEKEARTESRHLSIDRTRPYRKTYKVRKIERKKDNINANVEPEGRRSMIRGNRIEMRKTSKEDAIGYT